MKVLSIESPQRLKDKTVKATITVAEDNFIPLIMLADKAYKGDQIDITDNPTIKKDSRLQQTIEAITPIIQMSLDSAYKEGVNTVAGIDNMVKDLDVSVEQIDFTAFPETIKEDA